MDQVLHIAICEDLVEDFERLLAILKESDIPNTIAAFHSGEDFLAEFQMRKYDLIFMDIYMDGMTGIETATEIRKIDANVAIAFATTSLDYALESYRLEAIKYIEKPVTAKSVVPILQAVLLQKEYIPKITVKTKPSDTQIALNDILYLEQSGARYQVHLATGETITASGKLAAIMEQLGGSPFYHCHKSFIVNFTYVKSINKELLLFELITGAVVHIRRDGFWKTKRAYEAFLFEDVKRGAAHV